MSHSQCIDQIHFMSTNLTVSSVISDQIAFVSNAFSFLFGYSYRQK